MNAQQQMEAKIAKLSTEALKDMVLKLHADMRDGAEIALSAVLDALMNRLPEDDFVAFCDQVA